MSQNNNIGEIDIPANSRIREGGGYDQKCNNIYSEVGDFIEIPQPPKANGEGMEDLSCKIEQILGQNPIRIDPTKYTSIPELFNAVELHARRWQRLSKGTIDHRLRCARRMMTHPIFPIDFSKLSYEQFIAYMQYREDVEKAGCYALENDLRAIHTFLVAFGIDPRTWLYKLPIRTRNKGRDIPSPDIVHKIINFNYSEDEYTNALIQRLHAHNFWIGWRVPSEVCALTIDDVDFENGILTITEQKKHSSRRMIYPDNAILTGKTRKSFKNYLDYWRPKVECYKSRNAFYLTATGLPFTQRYLGHFLSETGKQVYPKFQPYVSRHWFACAKLVRTKIETGNFDVHQVKTDMGHDKITTTETYICQAIDLYRKYPFDWIKRTLKFDKIDEGESTLKSKQRQKTPVSTGKSGEGINGLSGI